MTLLESLLRVLGALAWERGLLIILEDLHWADADTFVAIEYLADNLGTQRALCLCTMRSDEPSPAASVVESLSSRRVSRRILLKRLTDGDVDAMVQAAVIETIP